MAEKPLLLSDATTDLAPAALKTMLDAGAPLLVLDVREPDEFDGWNIPGSVNVPLGDILAGASVAAAPDASVVTVCASGSRSEMARQVLARRGVRALNLSGGMVAWNGVYDVARLEAAGARVLQFRRVGKGCLSYMVIADDEALVIDPTADVDEYLRAADAARARIVAVLDTHAHADHVSGSRMLVARTGARYVAPDEVGAAVPHETARPGADVPVGGARVRVLETPGHTAASVTYLLGDVAFTGDTLFVESVGRPDLGQDGAENAAVLWRTLQERILQLPDATRVLPGHYGDAVTLQKGAPVAETLGNLRARLAPLAMDEPTFVAWVVSNRLPKPANFGQIKRINKGELQVEDPASLRWLEAGPNRCAAG